MFYADMIDIAAWRAIIGLFRPSNNITSNSKFDDFQPSETRLSFRYTAWPVFVFIPYVALLLMCSGDVELNPGPMFKNCPNCHEKVHIKQRYCECGYALRKSNRGTVPPSRATNLVHCEYSTQYSTDAGSFPETISAMSTQLSEASDSLECKCVDSLNC